MIIYLTVVVFTTISRIHKPSIKYLMTSIGGSVFIVVALSGVISKFLLLKPLKFLGKISYSIYLYHTVPVFSFIYLFILWGNINSNNTINSFFATLVSAILSYYFIEKPFTAVILILVDLKLFV
ncbi:peptidoglycan/LPS O-acetylase OafA/YrhL [Lederbergia wuyishanensis]|uniref:Peptidoglycan/LPS O-acetylase OafA/YrhL n=1 Tax=Lederbergia wuyishanensis TaxID=1347903 RepID=A0ABU0D375_9BACI|nr:peptidoglycan/LPS O-acetylase OafA/YrhL [Lederbergia wuyishanensis]